MKNLLLLLATAAILFSCGASNEDKKLEINQKIARLNKQINQRIDQKSELKRRLNLVYLKFDSLERNSSEADREINQAAFIKQIEKIQLQEIDLKKQDLLDELKIRKLEQEYAKKL